MSNDFSPFAEQKSLADLLKLREHELIQQTAAIRGLLSARERELADVRKAMRAVGLEHSSALSDLMATAEKREPTALEIAAEQALSAAGQNAKPVSPLERVSGNALSQLLQARDLTIKQMILGALRDHFHFHGATPTELSDYMKTAYGRDVDRNSISPQLARLRDEGFVEQPTGLLNEGRWQLTRAGRWYGDDARKTIAGGAGLDE
jgi:DNA-binding transcriptional ArsR family regulator